MNTKSRDYIKDYSIVNGNLIVTYGTNEKSKPLSLSDLESVKNKIREEIKDLKEEDTKLKRNYNKYRLYAALCILTSVLSLGAGTIISFGDAKFSLVILYFGVDNSILFIVVTLY